MRPVLDVYDLAVRLELEGITDSVAASDYGYSSTVQMANGHLKALLQKDRPLHKPLAKPGWVQFLNGIAFAIPVLICTVTTLMYHFSLWGGDLTSEMAAAVAIGTICSFVATGGIIQASARRTLYQIHMGNWDAAIFTCFNWTVVGVKVLAASLAAGWILNQYFAWLPYPIDWVAMSFHMILGLLWLACGILYVLELSWAVGGTVLAGIATVALLHKGFALPLLYSQLIGIAITALLSFALAAFVLARKRKHKVSVEFISLRIAHDMTPYFLYGCVYYLFLFADRFLAWTSDTAASMLPLHFRGDYETALDIAMIAFIVQAGWVHMSILAFYRRLNTSEANFTVSQSTGFNTDLKRFYFKRAGMFLPCAAAIGFMVYTGAVQFGLLPTAQMQKVAGVAVAAYPLLVLGLWNSSLFFALSRPVSPLISVVAGLAANVIIGYLFSRVGTYNDAVYGFAAGSAVFAILTTILYLRLSRSVDYSHFASAA